MTFWEDPAVKAKKSKKLSKLSCFPTSIFRRKQYSRPLPEPSEVPRRATEVSRSPLAVECSEVVGLASADFISSTVRDQRVQTLSVAPRCQYDCSLVLDTGSKHGRKCNCDTVANSRARIAAIQGQIDHARREDCDEGTIAKLVAEISKESLTPILHLLLTISPCYGHEGRLAVIDIFINLHEHEIFASGLVAPMTMPERRCKDSSTTYSSELGIWAKQEFHNRWAICDYQLDRYRDAELSRSMTKEHKIRLDPKLSEKLKESCSNLAIKIYRDSHEPHKLRRSGTNLTNKIIHDSLDLQERLQCHNKTSSPHKISMDPDLEKQLKDSCFKLAQKVLRDLSESEKRQYEERTSKFNRDELLQVIKDEKLERGYRGALPHVLNSIPSVIATTPASESSGVSLARSSESKESNGPIDTEAPQFEIWDGNGQEKPNPKPKKALLFDLDARMEEVNLLR